MYDVPVSGPITALCKYEGVPDSEIKARIVYGTANGNLGMIHLFANSGTKIWEIQGKYSVTAIACADFTKDNVEDILIGRDDGSIELFSFDVSPSPLRVFQRNVNESITAVKTGHIVSPSTMDILVSTYSGKIICYTFEQPQVVINILF